MIVGIHVIIDMCYQHKGTSRHSLKKLLKKLLKKWCKFNSIQTEVEYMKKGFTLVELLIVLAVIAALMAVATP
ncbi:MAG TPA: type II secretion system protein, partial [Fervidobacterium sp.]|nr:type II secretion system protein [Fervidobacterium sp.]